jgi:hypothetical protein
MSSQWYFRPGDYYQLDDLSGFKIRASRSRKIPGGQTGGLIVAPERWEPQHPQDFVRGVVDDQTVPQARPRQKNQFVITATYVTAFTPRGGNTITVDSVEGFSVGDRVTVMLDSGENYFPVVIRIVGNQMLLTDRLPASVGGPYADPIENVVIDMGPSGIQFLVDDADVPIVNDGTGNLLGTL